MSIWYDTTTLSVYDTILVGDTFVPPHMVGIDTPTVRGTV